MSERDRMAQDGWTSANLQKGLETATVPGTVTLKKSFTTANLEQGLKPAPASSPAPAPSTPVQPTPTGPVKVR